jgi:hypothetical protein
VFELPTEISGSLHVCQVEGLAHVLQVGNFLTEVEACQLPQSKRNSPRCQVYSHTDVFGSHRAFECKALQDDYGTSRQIHSHFLYHMFLLGGILPNSRLPPNIREWFSACTPHLGVDTLDWEGERQETANSPCQRGNANHRLKEREESTPPCKGLSR